MIKKSFDEIYFAKTQPHAILPSKREEDAGYDFYPCFSDDFMYLDPFETKLIPTGIAWSSSKKFYMQMVERSSTGSKGIKVSAGVIDSGYHGEIQIAIFNATKLPLYISNISEAQLQQKGMLPSSYIFHPTKKAIAQGIIHRVENLQVKELSYEQLLSIPSQRKDQGFGSTDKNI